MTKRTKIFLIVLGTLIAMTFILASLFSQSRFLKYCDDFFQEELGNNALTLHYTIAEPEKYGIECTDISLGSFDQNLVLKKWQLLRDLFTLKTISRNQLSSDLKRTYDLLNYSLHTELSRLDYSLLEEPLVPSIGIQSQLPILLAEYIFYSEADVKNYLALLECVPDYFDSLIDFETKKLEKNLFLDESTVKELITYCHEFLSQKESHFLSETFAERLSALNLNSSKTAMYLEKNGTYLETYVFPAYQKLQSFLEENQSKGQNADGLYYFPNGTDYYAWLLRSEIGCDKTFEEIESLLETALKNDAKIISQLAAEQPELLSERQYSSIHTANPAALTSYLAKRSEHDFPKIPQVSLKLCNVPKSMEAHLSPAFYLVPPIDAYDNNVIYLNQKDLKEELSFFTTLAHESYPGHLYQTIYENNTNPLPIERLLYFGGYTEGWGTYAEQLSYYYSPISNDLATLLSTTRAMTLNLYSHLDLYIHAYGWTFDDCSAYLKKFGITNTESVYRMFLLVKQQPANYLKYYLGYLEICALKEQAKDCLGSAFDLKEFHEFVLSYGPAPFSLLEQYLEEWLSKQLIP